MSLTMNYPRLARAVFSHISQVGVTPRSVLNSVFKTTSDDKKQEALSLVLKSMIAYGHLERHFDSANSIVHFWCKGQNSPYPKDDVTKLKPEDHQDWLTKPILQGVDVAPKVTTPPVQQPYNGVPVPPKVKPVVEVITPPLMNFEDHESRVEAFLRAPSPSLTESEKAEINDIVDGVTASKAVATQPANYINQGVGGPPDAVQEQQIEILTKIEWLKQQAQELTSDQFLGLLADEVPFFTKENAYTFLLKTTLKAVIGMRLSVMLRKGYLFEGTNTKTGEVVYWSPSKPVPPGHEPATTNVVGPPPKQKKGPNKKPRATFAPKEEWPPVKSWTAEEISKLHEQNKGSDTPPSPVITGHLDVTANTLVGESRAAIDSYGMLTLQQDTGQKVNFSAKDQFALFGLLRHMNINAMYEDLRVQLNKESHQ